MIFELAHLLGAVPILWLALMQLWGEKRGAAWWWLAGAFAVGWGADTLAHWASPWLASTVYLVSQAGIIGAVLLARREAVLLAAVLVGIAVLAILWRGVEGPDLLLHTVAMGSVAGIVWDRKVLGLLRMAFLVRFGVGLLIWWAYGLYPGWTTWGAYQSVRLAGVLLFCWAAVWPAPRLRLTI